jgi:hypothetical protein
VRADEVDEMERAIAEEMHEARVRAQAMSAQYLQQLGGVWEGLHQAGDDWSAIPCDQANVVVQSANGLSDLALKAFAEQEDQSVSPSSILSNSKRFSGGAAVMAATTAHFRSRI